MSRTEKSVVLVQYVRHPHDYCKLVGCVAAVCWNGEVRVGWSQCNPLDQFKKARAKQIAVDRAWMGTRVKPTPYKFYNPDGSHVKRDTVTALVEQMRLRAERYFNRHPEQGGQAEDRLHRDGTKILVVGPADLAQHLRSKTDLTRQENVCQDGEPDAGRFQGDGATIPFNIEGTKTGRMFSDPTRDV